MYRIGTRSTTRYKYHDGWRNGQPTFYWIDVTTTGDSYEAWIQEEDGGVAALMFEVPFRQPNGEIISYDGFLELVEGNLEALGARSYLIDEGR